MRRIHLLASAVVALVAIGTSPTAADATPTDTVMRWTVGAGDTLTIPVDRLFGPCDFTIDWGETGSTPSAITSCDDADLAHTYTAAGTYTTTITDGTDLDGLEGWTFIDNTTDRTRLVEVVQWGDMTLANTGQQFEGTTNMVVAPTAGTLDVSGVSNMRRMFLGAARFNQDIGNWDTSAVTDMSDMFRGAAAFNQPLGYWTTSGVLDMSGMFHGATAFNQDLGDWNTSNVTSMKSMFNGATAFNGALAGWGPRTSNVTTMELMFAGATAFNRPIGAWNTSSVTHVSGMFQDATAFNQPIGTWNTSNVTTMELMFAGATAFDQPLGDWNTSRVTHMAGMFRDATAFNQPLAGWDTSRVTTMGSMFHGATAFDQPLAGWNTASVTHMDAMFLGATAFNRPIGGWSTANVRTIELMFYGATAFDQPLAGWNTANVTHMNGAFEGATAFNQPLAGWDTSRVTTMSGMFRNATAFNQPIGAWNTANVTHMDGMLQRATAFDRDLGAWDTSRVTTMEAMLRGTGLSPGTYSDTLIGWAAPAACPRPRELGANDLRHLARASAARARLTGTCGWTIVDAGLEPAPDDGPDLRIGEPRVTRRAIITTFTAEGPGRATQVATIVPASRGQRARAIRACSTTVRVRKAGVVRLTCTLTTRARALRAKRSLTLRLVTAFTPGGGQKATDTRAVVLRRG